MKAKTFMLTLIVALAFFLPSVSAQVPNRISYQGKLVTPQGGLIIDTTVSMVFSIYTDSTGGTALWTETQSSVKVSNSVFNAILGSVTSIPDSIFRGSIRYLGLRVGGDSEMTPRKPIVSVAYAYKAGTNGQWVFRITDTADTTLTTGGAWGIARYGNILYGNTDSTHVNLGIASTTGMSGQNYKYCTVGGGANNTANHDYATVAGGRSNLAGDSYATVGGGSYNNASGSTSTVGGGQYDTASGAASFVGGGYDNSVSGSFSTIPGGYSNFVSGSYSFAAGNDVNLTASNTFVFGKNFTTSTAHAVIFYDADNAIKMGVQVTAPTHYIDVAGGAYCNGTNWVNASSRKYKKDISSLTQEEYQQILKKLAGTEVVRYRYKSEDNGRTHIGVIAEDAPEDIVDAERTGIPTGDAIGFLLAAVKAQQEKLNVQQEEIEALKAKLEKLESNR